MEINQNDHSQKVLAENNEQLPSKLFSSLKIPRFWAAGS